MTQLLELRKQIKKKKPYFLRQEAHKKKKIPINWRKPRGIHSKLRHGHRGHGKKLQVGYGSPREVRFLSPSGRVQVMIHTLSDIVKLDVKKDIAVIGHSVGIRKNVLLVAAIHKKGCPILQIPNPEEYIKGVEDGIKKRKAEKTTSAAKKEEKKKEAKDMAVKPIDEKLTIKEKKDIEKKELDSALIHREK